MLAIDVSIFFSDLKQGVNQLQQLIADSGVTTGANLPFFNPGQQRSVVNLSADYPLFSDTRDSSRTYQTMGSDYARPPWVRPPLTDAGPTSPISVQPSLHSLKLPFQPNWLYERPTLWDDFLPPKKAELRDSPMVPIDTLSNAAQEHAVVGDLLQCLQGNQGVYIKPLPLVSRFGSRSFSVDENMTPTLLDTVNKILPICSDYSNIVRFVGAKSMFEHGVVNQALAGAIRRLIKDYLVLLCQLEHQYRIGQLGIARLQFFLRDTATIFTQIGRVVVDITRGSCSGGAVLSLLYDHARTVYGVKQMNELLSYLLRAASVPFFKILQKWIYRGVISDPYQEFFIEAGPTPDFVQPSGHLTSHDRNQLDQIAHEYVDWAFFWERHYSVVPTNLPSFLESHVNKILNTGKYLNVVQQCADAYELPQVEPLEFEETEMKYLDQIERAHLYASSLLLKLMTHEKDLKEHLRSIKRYFLLDQADFIVHFMDAAAKELCKPSTVMRNSSLLCRNPDVSLLRLSSLLELAIRTSTAVADPLKDNLKVVIFQYDLITQIFMVLRAGSGLDPDPPAIEDMNLTGLEAFSVDYCVSWPVSLVLNRQVMDRYQMLFRHLFYCKHVERRLCNAWVLGKLARRADNLTMTWFTTAFLLSQRMLTFIQHFQYYMSVEVIEPTWLQFFNQLNKLSNLDALLDAHLHCLEVCMDDCLLASPDLMSLFGKLCVVCVLFGNFVQHVIASSTDGLNLGPNIGAGDTLLMRPRDSSPSNSSIWSADGMPHGRLDFNDFYTVYSAAPTASGFNDNIGVYNTDAGNSYFDHKQPSDVASVSSDYAPPISKPRTRRPLVVAPDPPSANLMATEQPLSNDPEDDYI
ncbi:Gamma-tubulin complex component [Fasciolopsis buskii]|uniref:Gamma-tubulin complex component n=1 Tax=Fasciolopsis buskii TaxID=27845 RepID=A0A8E0S6P1_9TREM|nr:Gamma-tubulin complex component [Fasciolopsis buski]